VLLYLLSSKTTTGMIYEALLGLYSLSPSFFFMNSPRIYTSSSAAAAAPIDTILEGGGGTEGAPSKRRSTDFDFSTYQQQHREAAWTLATFSPGGAAGAGAGAGTGAGATPQGDLRGHNMAGEAVMTTTTTTSRSIYPDDLPISICYQKEQRQERQDQRMPPPPPRLRVDPNSVSLVPQRPCLVVGPGQFGGKVGLLNALQPPELIKYLTVSDCDQVGKCVLQLVRIITHFRQLIYTNTHTHINTKQIA
jgi:hypothetical protein